MILLTPELRAALRANHAAHLAAERDGRRHDPIPVVKFFNPLGGAARGSGDAQHRWNGCGGAATWVATELYDDGDTLLGVADLGFGSPEMGVFSLSEIASVRLPFGLGIERDLDFASDRALAEWAEPPEVPTMRSIVGMAAEGDTACRLGSIIFAEAAFRRAGRDGNSVNPLPRV